MKTMKRIGILVLLLVTVCCAALAENRVIDEADLLTDQEEAALESRIEEIRSRYSMDVALVALKNARKNGRSFKLFAADYFDEHGFGLGADKDGLMFILDMGERDYSLDVHGKGIKVFTDYGRQKICDDIVPFLSQGQTNEAFTRLLNYAEKYLKEYETSGVAYDVGHKVQLLTPWQRVQKKLPVILVIAVVVTLIVMLILKNQMKTVRRKADAASYIRDGSFQLSRSQDIYLYTTTTRRRIEQNNGGGGGRSGGGSTTFRSSSGSSHASTSGKF